ncbi:hypothetical protein PAMA_000677 [Pampus argenteus]
MEVRVFDRVASLPQVKGNLASCREREGKKTGQAALGNHKSGREREEEEEDDEEDEEEEEEQGLAALIHVWRSDTNAAA